MNILIWVAISLLTLGGVYISQDDGIGAISFPSSLDSLTNPSASDSTATVSHSGQHSDANDGIEALQTKVGADGSAVTSTHDYKLGGVTGSDKAVSLAGTETLTNKTLTSPSVTGMTATNTTFFATTTMNGTTTIDTSGAVFSLDLGSDATGDIYYRNSSGDLTRLGVGSGGQFLLASSTGLAEWSTQSPSTPTLGLFEFPAATSTATTSATTDGTQDLYVWATGNFVYVSGTGERFVYLHYDGKRVATTTATLNATDTRVPFALIWASTTPNTIGIISVTEEGHSGFEIENIQIVTQIF